MLRLPVGIFSLSDRDEIFDGAALTILLILATLAVLLALSARSRARVGTRLHSPVIESRRGRRRKTTPLPLQPLTRAALP
jgi:hypothetical protein